MAAAHDRAGMASIQAVGTSVSTSPSSMTTSHTRWVTRYPSEVGATSSTAHWWLRLSTRQDLGILGPLGVAVRNCENLGEAMQTASRYMFVHSPAISFTPTSPEREDHVRLVFEILLDRVGTAVQVTELSVGLAARTVMLLADDPSTLTGVRFRHKPAAPLFTYENHFRVPVEFGCDDSAIELEAAALSYPIHDASLQIRELAEDYLQLDIRKTQGRHPR